jgi:protein-S-isoprenylcysteine O-methyltransferase Ste14
VPVERHHIKGLIKGILVITYATFISYILVIILRVTIGREAIKTILVPVDITIPDPIKFCGLLVLALGFVLVIWANYTLLVIGKIGFTAREPFHVPHTLVTEGPYKFTRNPIYLAVVLLAFGAGLVLDSVSFLILSPGLFYVFQKWFISWEEKKLEEKFGDDYREFKSQVRRWF